MKRVFILVKVTYDYYRFQDNIGVFSDVDSAIQEAKKQSPEYPIYFYNENENDELDEKELCHYLIQSFLLL